MPKFTVYFTSTVSTAVKVEANDYEAAIEAAYDSDDMPSSQIPIAAFGGANVDSSDDWQPAAVEDADGNEVWREKED